MGAVVGGDDTTQMSEISRFKVGERRRQCQLQVKRTSI
jgi:hypothetical protein